VESVVEPVIEAALTGEDEQQTYPQQNPADGVAGLTSGEHEAHEREGQNKYKDGGARQTYGLAGEIT
jgi:hypothetical protein